MYSYKNKKPLDYYNELEKKEIEIYNDTYFNENDIANINKIDLNNIFNIKKLNIILSLVILLGPSIILNIIMMLKNIIFILIS